MSEKRQGRDLKSIGLEWGGSCCHQFRLLRGGLRANNAANAKKAHSQNAALVYRHCARLG
jgi:hypothetical protein